MAVSAAAPVRGADGLIHDFPPGPRRAQGVLGYASELLQPSATVHRKSTEAMEYGDIAGYHIGPFPIIQVQHPDLIQEAFVKNGRFLQRGDPEAVQWVIGNGLLAVKQPEHKLHRRAIQPEFKRFRVAMYCVPMADSVEKHVTKWQDGQRVDFLHSMSMLGTDITGKTLFGLDLEAETEELGHDFDRIIKYIFQRQTQTPRVRRLLHSLPLPKTRAFRRSMEKLDSMVYGLIKERQESDHLNDDLITVLVQQQKHDREIDIYALMAARMDEERRLSGEEAEAAENHANHAHHDNGGHEGHAHHDHSGHSGHADHDHAHTKAAAVDGGIASSIDDCPVSHGFLTDKQVRDEALTFLVAGQESYHISASWIMHYLSVNPSLQERLHQEVDEVLGDRRADLADFPRFEFIDSLIREGLRIHAPLGVLGRIAIEDITVGDYLIPKGQIVIAPTYHVHRSERFYDDPLTFNPDRWTDEFRRNLHRCAYLPFGIGAHRCIGEQFAWMQLRLTLAAIGQRWWVRPDPTHEVGVATGFTVAPKGGMPLYLEARKK